MKTQLHCWTLLATLTVLSCNEKPLDPRSRVITPRVLAIIAEPPEVRPGQIVSIRVVTGGVTGTPTFKWTACTRPEATTTFTAQSTFGEAQPDEGCFGDAAVGVLPLGEGDHVSVPVPADLLEQLEALRSVYGSELPVDTLQRIARTAGIPVTVALEMTDGDTVVRAIKRVVVADHDNTDTNPPPPHFRFDTASDAGEQSVALGFVGGHEDLCAGENFRPLRVRPGQRVEISPDPTESAWLQNYDSLDSSGNISHLSETAFYAWFTTDGWFDVERTRIPARDTVWQAPGIPGHVTQWIVVRDGRGGASACRYEIEVR